MAVADLPPASNKWRTFPSAVHQIPPVRLDASRKLAEGLYRTIAAWGMTCYTHVDNEASVACADMYVQRTGAPVAEVAISWGTRVQLWDEVAIYGGESVDRRTDGILICGSRF